MYQQQVHQQLVNQQQVHQEQVHSHQVKYCNMCMKVEFDKRKAIHHQGIIQLQFSQCCEQCLIENIQRKSQIDFS